MCENAENKEQQLNEIFERIGEENGMRASAEFAAFTDLKVKWVRTSDWAEFRVSDYLRDAPEGVIEDLARTIMARIRGCGGDYTERATAWLTAPGVLGGAQASIPGEVREGRERGRGAQEHRGLSGQARGPGPDREGPKHRDPLVEGGGARGR